MTSARAGRPLTRAVTHQLPAATGGGVITRTVLPGGLRVVTEAMPGVRSASVGVWVPVGSRDESPSLAGTSHFLEHLLFKGTTSRSALDIASAMDAVGGEFNAFTEKEHTCYYATVLDRDLDLAVDIVTDVVLNATITAQDVDVERGVVLEEIAMRDDDPSDLVHDEFSHRAVRRRAARPAHPRHRGLDPHPDPPPDPRLLPAPLHRRRDGGVGRRQRRARRRRAARPARVRRRLDRRGPRDRRAPRSTDGPRQRPADAVTVVPDDTEQANLVLGCHGLSRHDPRRYALGVLSSALGGGMSSRLFQRVREERGLAYSVYSFSSGYADAGQFGVYAGCQPGKADEVLSLMTAELDAVAAGALRAGRDRARQGPDARRHRPRPRGRRLADDPHRQERDRLRRHPRAWTRCLPASTR